MVRAKYLQLKEKLYRQLGVKAVSIRDEYGNKFLFGGTDALARHWIRRSLTDDPSVLAYIWRENLREEICIDIGAGFGAITLPMANRCKFVYSIEAETSNYEKLVKNLAVNNISNVQPLKIAVADTTGESLLNVAQSPQAYGWHTLADRSMLDPELFVRQERVRVVSLDLLCHFFDIREIGLLKIDVEGFEPRVFQGMASVLADKRARRIIFEHEPPALHRCGHTVADLFNPLIDAGYRVVRLDENCRPGSMLLPSDIEHLGFANLLALPD